MVCKVSVDNYECQDASHNSVVCIVMQMPVKNDSKAECVTVCIYISTSCHVLNHC